MNTDRRLSSGGLAQSPALRRILAVAIVALLVADLSLLYVRQGPSPVSVDAALAEFRKGSASATTTSAATKAPGESTPTSSAGAAATHGRATDPASGTATVSPGAGGGAGDGPAAAIRPRPGVYGYKTSGYETVDVAGGARHDYPSETAITVQRVGCGWSERWQPLKERWDQIQLCAEPTASSATDYRSYHEFFKKAQEQHFTCPAGTQVARFDQPAGSRWSWACTSGPSRFESTTTYVGLETLTIGGEAVQAARFHHDSVMTGANRGKQVQERWVHPSTGLTVAVQSDIDAEADSPFGTVKYREHFRLDLVSLTPQT